MSSKREDILDEITGKLLAVDGIKTVRRKPISSVKELNEISNQMFPVVTISGGLPRPLNGNPIELGEESDYSSIRSVLDIFIRIFGYEKENPDTAISEIMNIVYPALYYDPTLKGYNFTSKTINASISTDDIILCVDNVLEIYQYNFYKSLTDYGYVADLSTPPYGNPTLFEDVTDSLIEKIQSVSVRPSEIMEYRDPYYIFTLIMTVEYIHSTIEI